MRAPPIPSSPRSRRSATAVTVLTGLLAACSIEKSPVGAPEPLPLDVAADPDPFGPDSDGDGLSDTLERMGWMIAVDLEGYGTDSLRFVAVKSDPTLPDTDRDGLSDADELRHRTDPRSPDTDIDLLGDREEIFQWKTIPTSVDSDGDARGPDPDFLLPPNPRLFDGSEAKLLGTSPTLADTDGDNRTDYEEVDHPLRNPRVAELPRVALDFEGEVDIRLFVEYEETVGVEEEFGSTFSTQTSTTTSASDATSSAVVTAADKGGAGVLDEIIMGAASDGKKGAATAVVGPLAESFRGPACDKVSGDLENKTSFSNLAYDSSSNDSEGGFLDDLGDAAWSAGEVIVDTAKDFAGLARDTLCNEATPESTSTTTSTLSLASTLTATEEHTRLRRESRSRTERASRGTVKVGARIRNEGIFAWELKDLFVTMMQWQSNPDPNLFARDGAGHLGTGAFRTLATLRPVIDSFVLGPGDSTPVIELTAADVNPEIIKGFLARPDTLFYSPAGFELVNAQGIDFEFLTEETVGRTASVTFDFGGDDVETFVVATNVARYSLEDELDCRRSTDCAAIEGELAGIRMQDLFASIDVPYTTILRGVIDEDGEPVLDEEGNLLEVEVLDTIREVGNAYPKVFPDRLTGVPGEPVSFWSIHYWRGEQADPLLDFNDVVVRHGDNLRFIFLEDKDGDGLYAHQEDMHGTSDDDADTDGDGLFDFQELKLGWRVCILPNGESAPQAGEIVERDRPCYYVYSDPLSSDADRDGLPDSMEREKGTDPNNADTDDDSLVDGQDPNPLTPGGRLFVDQRADPGGNGTSWASAFDDLGEALEAANAANANTDPADDVTQVWLAAGTYKPGSRTERFRVQNLGLYGGFAGTETRRGQRNPDPFTNRTILSGDINGDDTFEFGSNTFDNADVVVELGNRDASLPMEVSTLDGLTIQSARGAGVLGGGAGQLTVGNCLFFFNDSNINCVSNGFCDGGGIALTTEPGLPAVVEAALSIEDCFFIMNRVGADITTLGAVRVSDCEFLDLFSDGLTVNTPGNIDVERCRFERTDRVCRFSQGSLRLSQCEFRSNTKSCLYVATKDTLVDQCVFADNEFTNEFFSTTASLIGFALGPEYRFDIVNSTIANNTSVVDASRDILTSATILGLGTPTLFDQPSRILNSILWGNRSNVGPGGQVPSGTIEEQQVRNIRQVETSFLEGLSFFSGNGNIGRTGETPRFLQEATGNLRLQSDSPCIDGGNDFVDFDLRNPGLQLAPEEDLDGNLRILDGRGDGRARIDLGPYEFQGFAAAQALLDPVARSESPSDEEPPVHGDS